MQEIDPSIRSYLLTGATGLVGRYLLAGLLRRGCDVAVLVRSSNTGSAAERINDCLAVFEQERLLPRPRIIEGDLTSQQLVTNPRDQDWFQGRPINVIHCAASIRFVTGRDGEPYRSNVEGTRHLLELCRNLDTREFHYVSTAYVGCRSNAATIKELPVADPELAGNDYERSKIEAEKLLADCSWISKHVIHRPSIVIGDSRTGYTSTFHGFYAPLQIGAQFAKEFGLSHQLGHWFRQQLGIQATDSKNLVPVDWVAASILEMTSKSLPSGTILHWTNPQPVSCEDMQQAIVDSIEEHSRKSGQTSDREPDLPSAHIFTEQMDAYETYFGNDPAFDTTHARRYCPYIPCPQVDYASLKKTAEYALSERFGWPKPRLGGLPHPNLRSALRSRADRGTPHRESVCLDLTTLGSGAVETLVFAQHDEGWTICHVPSSDSHLRLVISMDRLADCIFGTTTMEDLICHGNAAIVGSLNNEWPRLVADWLNDVKSRAQPE